MVLAVFLSLAAHTHSTQLATLSADRNIHHVSCLLLDLNQCHNCAMQGILDQAGRRTLSKLIYCLFTPALTFTKLAPVLSGQHLVLWMPLVINMFVR